MLLHREIVSEIIIRELLYINLKLFYPLRKLSSKIIGVCFGLTTVNDFYFIQS